MITRMRLANKTIESLTKRKKREAHTRPLIKVIERSKIKQGNGEEEKKIQEKERERNGRKRKDS